MDNAGTAVGLFQFAVQTLGCIQLAREFEDDFGVYQLKLDIIQLRLSRWGQIARISTIDNTSKDDTKSQPVDEEPSESLALVKKDDSENSTKKGDSENSAKKEDNENQQADEEHMWSLASVKRVLDNIQDLLYKAQRNAKELKKKMNYKDNDVLDPESCMPKDLQKIRNRFKEFCHRRKVQASKAFEGIKWTIYAKEYFDKFAADMLALINNLEEMMPENEREKLNQLSDQECKGISKSNLEELKGILEGCDPWLEKSVDKSLSATEVGTVINQAHNMGHTVGIHNGDNKGVAYGARSRQTITFK